MMNRLLSLAVGLVCLCAAVQAEVPSLINYQGRLTDKAGTPVNGAVDVVLRVYDAKTEGKKVYEETIPQVSVVNGVYSFGYGGAGKSTKRAVEVVAWADGEAKVYNYSTEHKPLLMDVQLSDGTYTWGSQSGPSDAAQFIGSINAELGNVTAIYIQNAPAKDTIINTIYHYHEEGIIGALSQNKECWQELTINGKTLSPRERLVSVPYAAVAGKSRITLGKIYTFSDKFKFNVKILADKDMLLVGQWGFYTSGGNGVSAAIDVYKEEKVIRGHRFRYVGSTGNIGNIFAPIKKGEIFYVAKNGIGKLWVVEL